jgi:MFS superfamily sulfate permease-like transporter
MLYSFLLFIITLSLQQVYREKLASTEIYTILGGLISSILFLLVVTFIGNLQESVGARTGWGAVIVAELIAAVAAGAVHRVCVTTW